MSATTALLDFVLLVLVSLVPALIYLTWVRGTERYGTAAWGPILGAFAYGALFATIVAAILEAIIVGLGTSISNRYPGPEFLFLNGNSTAGAFFLVLVVAPFIEEALKGSGVYAYRSQIRSVADGPVFGASVGLGFGFFETFLYGLSAYIVGGLEAGIALILVRSVSAVVLHGSSTGMFGYGFARSQKNVPGPGTGSYYLLAVAMHATYNAIASLAVILTFVGITGVAVSLGAYVALLAAILFAFVAIEHVRQVIAASDYPALLPAGATRARPPPRR
jgi:RsiW-degrading membrane proteinase PrsW (M82 family)